MRKIIYLLCIFCFLNVLAQRKTQSVLSYNAKSYIFSKKLLDNWTSINYISDTSDISIVLIQGLYSSKVAEQILATSHHSFKYSHYNQSTGLLIISKTHYKIYSDKIFHNQSIKDLFFKKGYIVVEYDKFYVGNIHLTSWSDHLKRKQLSELDSLYKESNSFLKPLVIIGDFNIDNYEETPKDLTMKWETDSKNIIRNYKDNSTESVIGNHLFVLQNQYFIKKSHFTIIEFIIK